MRAFLIFFTLAHCAVAAASEQRYTVTRSGEIYGITVAVMAPEALPAGEINVTVSDSQGELIHKTLHPMDLDLYVTVRPRRAGEIIVHLDNPPPAAKVRVEFSPLSLANPKLVASQPNADWKTAQSIDLGTTIFGSSDERPYVPASPSKSYAALVSGFQWFRLTAPKTQLVYFTLDTPGRDVPPDLDIFELRDNELSPYAEGASSYVPEATQNFPGLSPFRTRILKAGSVYYLRVAANHPFYRLRTDAYGIHSPQTAVRAGMDFLVNLGDAWLANTPRRGSVALRNSLTHPEAQSCIACHPTQFTTRAYLTAVKNGYPNTRPNQLDLLLTRLQNNPRPLYGFEDANWARVIFSARTVASRLPVLLDFAGRPNRAVELGFANYLTDAGASREEPDGCQPMVSASEIDLQAWQTYSLMVRDFPYDPKWMSQKTDAARRIVEHIPTNVIDLAWKLIAYTNLQLPTRDLVADLYRWQQPNGRFPLNFDANSKPADFITFQALYALALAGERPEKVISYVLKSQRPDGSWQGEPEYKGFNTPFRDTQFAVMALSTLFPYSEPAPKQPAKLRTEHLDELLSDIDETIPTAQLSRVLEQSKWVLARAAAAEELGRIGDAQSLPALTHALADPSKLVQRSAAWSLRKLNAAPAILQALNSTDARSRWGALRALKDEFRDLSPNPDLLLAVQRALNDPAPQNRFQAADSLWRWYAWTNNNSILQAVASRMTTEPDANVQRALQESVYNMLDENEGQLAAWQRTLPLETDRTKIDTALHKLRREQSEIIARQLQLGNRHSRLLLLNSLWDFHMRHMAIPADNSGKLDVILPAFQPTYSSGVPRLHDKDFVYEPYRETADFRYSARNGFQIVRLGNDSDLIHLFSDSGSALEQALLACLKDADPEMKLQVIKAGSVLGDAVTPEFTAAMLTILDGKQTELSSAVRYVYEKDQRGKLRLSPELAPLCAKLLNGKNTDALAVVLPLLASSDLTRDPELAGALEPLLIDEKLPVFESVLRAAAHFPAVANSVVMRSQLLASIQTGTEQSAQAAIEIVLSQYITDARLTALAQQFLDAMQGRRRTMLLDQLDPAKYSLKITAANSYRTGGDAPLPVDDNLFSSALVVDTIAQSLVSEDRGVREAASDLVSQQDRLKSEPTIAAAYKKPERSDPDLEFFLARVQPILQQAGSDGKACVMCHASHALFPLRPANRAQRPEAEQNYRNALKMINVNEPRKSLLLIKPTKPNDSVSDPTLYLGSHNGGERWAGNEASPQYQTILDWIRGARVSSPPPTSACSGCRADGHGASQ